ncbi:hypothetical protein [Brevundimonas intermedia]|uniref:hypothetical protein n=1 Tax=Brevundimonas intermedia TaxID=74315 RepID=UPI0032082CBC
MFTKILIPTIALSLAAGAALAQTAPAPSAPAPAAKTARPTIDSTIEALVANPETKPIMEKHFAEVLAHAAFEQFKGMTLGQLAPLSGGLITEEKIAAADTDIKALPAH